MVKNVGIAVFRDLTSLPNMYWIWHLFCSWIFPSSKLEMCDVWGLDTN